VRIEFDHERDPAANAVEDLGQRRHPLITSLDVVQARMSYRAGAKPGRAQRQSHRPMVTARACPQTRLTIIHERSSPRLSGPSVKLIFTVPGTG
jgi:hypothetical protein